MAYKNQSIMSLNIEKVCCKKARSKNDKICDVCKAVLSIELNVAILGSGGVGKSQITVSYLGGKFCKRILLKFS